MVTITDFLNNILSLLDKYYPRKKKNQQLHQNGVIVTNENREIISQQSLHATSNLITGLSKVATSNDYRELDNIPTNLSDFTIDTNFTIDYTKITNPPTKLTDFNNNGFTLDYNKINNAPTKLTDFNSTDFTLPYTKITNPPTKLTDFSNTGFTLDYDKINNTPTISASASQTQTNNSYKIGEININNTKTTFYGINTDTTYTAGTGMNLSGTTFNHSNNITAQSTSALKKIKYDAQGHITGTDNVSSTDIANLGVKITDTVYTHPSTHASSMITESSALSNIGTNANTNQHNINNAINTKIGQIHQTKIECFTDTNYTQEGYDIHINKNVYFLVTVLDINNNPVVNENIDITTDKGYIWEISTGDSSAQEFQNQPKTVTGKTDSEGKINGVLYANTFGITTISVNNTKIQFNVTGYKVVQTITQGNINIYVYSNGENVYVAINGSITQNNAGYVDLKTKVDSTYCPLVLQTVDIERAVTYDVFMSIHDDGVIRIGMGTGSATRTGLGGGILYPLKSTL